MNCYPRAGDGRARRGNGGRDGQSDGRRKAKPEKQGRQRHQGSGAGATGKRMDGTGGKTAMAKRDAAGENGVKKHGVVPEKPGTTP